MNGPGATSLEVKVVTTKDEFLKATFNVEAGNNEWTRRSVKLTPTDGYFQVKKTIKFSVFSGSVFVLLK